MTKTVSELLSQAMAEAEHSKGIQDDINDVEIQALTDQLSYAGMAALELHKQYSAESYGERSVLRKQTQVEGVLKMYREGLAELERQNASTERKAGLRACIIDGMREVYSVGGNISKETIDALIAVQMP